MHCPHCGQPLHQQTGNVSFERSGITVTVSGDFYPCPSCEAVNFANEDELAISRLLHEKLTRFPDSDPVLYVPLFAF